MQKLNFRPEPITRVCRVDGMDAKVLLSTPFVPAMQGLPVRVTVRLLLSYLFFQLLKSSSLARDSSAAAGSGWAPVHSTKAGRSQKGALPDPKPPLLSLPSLLKKFCSRTWHCGNLCMCASKLLSSCETCITGWMVENCLAEHQSTPTQLQKLQQWCCPQCRNHQAGFTVQGKMLCVALTLTSAGDDD